MYDKEALTRHAPAQPRGNSRYRENCSGYVYQRIFEHLRPRVFTDPWWAVVPRLRFHSWRRDVAERK